MIVIIDVSMGNLHSLKNAFTRIGLAVTEATSAEALVKARGIILPGVGAFGAAMDNLDARGFTPELRRIARIGDIPILGICLGMQLLADESEEHGLHAGLGLIPGRVVRLSETETKNRVPNVGWCKTSFVKPSSLQPPGTESANYYYVHSFHLDAASPDDVAATSLLGHREIVGAVERGNIAGVQFHPEKSQDGGLDLLSTWAKAKRFLT